MRFRINLYLKLIVFFKAFISNKKNIKNEIIRELRHNSKKKFFNISSQLRISFMILLEFLKKENPKKNEIIFINYNLPEMVNIAKNLKYKIVFANINIENWFINPSQISGKITNNTIAIVLTNMFNNSRDTIKIKNLCKKKKINLIEDNAIYFDNFVKKNKRKIYSGSFGDYSLYSFNIMKNISALYGGGISHNSIKFNKFFSKYEKKLDNFPKIILIKQLIIFFVLKVFSNNFFYKYFFFWIVNYSHKKNLKNILKLFYPSLKFKIIKFPKYYFSKISKLSLKLIYFQLSDKKQRRYNHNTRLKNNNLYLKLFKKKKIIGIKYPKITEKNYQNFIDFPIMVKNKENFLNFMLNHKIELRSYYYQDCRRIFYNEKSDKFEDNIVCLPNHKKIDKKYIIKIVNKINDYSLLNVNN